LFFHGGVDAILKNPSLPNHFHNYIERGSSHPKHLDNPYIIADVYLVKVICSWWCAFCSATTTWPGGNKRNAWYLWRSLMSVH
jgi:hypothetical protein